MKHIRLELKAWRGGPNQANQFGFGLLHFHQITGFGFRPQIGEWMDQFGYGVGRFRNLVSMLPNSGTTLGHVSRSETLEDIETRNSHSKSPKSCFYLTNEGLSGSQDFEDVKTHNGHSKSSKSCFQPPNEGLSRSKP